MYKVTTLGDDACTALRMAAVITTSRDEARGILMLRPRVSEMSEAKRSKTDDADLFDVKLSDYHECTRELKKALDSALNSPDRFQPLSKREERSVMPLEAVVKQSKGRYLTLHRGLQILKGPEDLLIYQQMFWHIKPRTVIELGTFAGGSAIWMGDMFKTVELDCHCYSVDIDHSLLPEEARKMKPDNVTFLLGDCNEIDKTLTPEMLSKLPHPIIVMDDAHVNTYNNLCYFHKYLQVGDYVVVEDTSPNVPKLAGGGLCFEYEPVGINSKLEEFKRFAAKHEEEYAVDSYFTDFYGYNFLSHWNGIVRRMK